MRSLDLVDIVLHRGLKSVAWGGLECKPDAPPVRVGWGINEAEEAELSPDRGRGQADQMGALMAWARFSPSETVREGHDGS